MPNLTVSRLEPSAGSSYTSRFEGMSRGAVWEVVEGEEEDEKVLVNGGIAQRRQVSYLPRHMRGFGWRNPGHVSSRTAHFTIVDSPLPRPPASERLNTAALQTIRDYPHLFRVHTPVRVDRLAVLLRSHPNPDFVASVLVGLREGFWPWADTRRTSDYPETWDNSWAPPSTLAEKVFIAAQRDTEIEKGRFSPVFGPDLLPGMYSTPVLAVPKKGSNDLRLVSNQSAGLFSQNSMIDRAQTSGARLDTLKQFIPALLNYRRSHPNDELVLWKSDVSEAFRLLPMHPLWQIKQVTTSNIPTKDELAAGVEGGKLVRTTDWMASFGGSGSPRLWASLMGLVIWIAIFIKLLAYIFCYVDDAFSWEHKKNMTFYPPYNRAMPHSQVQLLLLWDWLGLPHKDKKQQWGEVLSIIGFLVDVNNLTATLPVDAKADLIMAVREFASTPSRRRPLQEFQRLTGWLNWSFNVYPLFRPALCHTYEKLAGKSGAFTALYINQGIRRELAWFAEHVEKSSGMLFFANLDWNPRTEADWTIYCDASLAGMGFWIPALGLGFYCPVSGSEMRDRIFYWEALCVLSALYWLTSFELRGESSAERPLRLTAFTDSSNTVDLFDSLAAKPDYNPILMAAVDLRIEFDVDLRVLHVPGLQNGVADAISRAKFDEARSLCPGLIIQDFTSPPLVSGTVAE